MLLYNTANPTEKANFETAVFQGLATEGGLFMPEKLPRMSESFFEKLPHTPFAEMAFEVCNRLLGTEIPEARLRQICEDAFNFEVPLVQVDKTSFCLELFHGPSLAFKDFGARFMSRVMAYFNGTKHKPLHILVATSGDTGGAVAMGFHNVPGTKVTILYPKNRVSQFQEAQLTRLGGNVQALEVAGSFDDCQQLVKQAFADRQLSAKEGLTSANSINIARLIPQTLYYFWAWGQLQKAYPGKKVVFSVPSGNFGNICAGAFAWKMGLPVEKLVASVNANHVFTDYLKTGKFIPMVSKSTISNAMDVGNPSNFVRIESLFGGWPGVSAAFESFSFTDQQTIHAMESLWGNYGYLSEPHAAVGWLGLQSYRAQNETDAIGVFLGTAHPAKFMPCLPATLQKAVVVPGSLTRLLDFDSHKKSIAPRFEAMMEAAFS